MSENSSLGCGCRHCQQPDLHRRNFESFDIQRYRTRAELLAQVEQFSWVHTIDLGDGLSSPGHTKPEMQTPCRRALEGVDFRGKKVLDIGCNDGLWSFEAERLGAAEVYSTDLVSQVHPRRDPCYRLAHKLRGSRAHYFPDVSVFDVERLGVRDFDIVLYLGVYYHLRDPLLSFSRLRRVMKDDALLIVEGHVSADPEPIARFYYRKHLGGDRSNWWVPSVPCLRQWVESSFFEVEAEFPFTEFYSRLCDPEVDTGRHTLRARAVRKTDPNWGFVDDELHEFDRNAYDGHARVGAVAPRRTWLDVPKAYCPAALRPVARPIYRALRRAVGA